MSEDEEVTVPKALLERVLDRLDELEERIGGYREQNERDKAKIRQQITQVEQKAVDDTDEDAATAQPDENGVDDEPTPMERLLQMGAEGVMADVTASVRRAQTIAEHFREWASRTPSGFVVKGNLRTLLNTALGERLQWTQIYRACRALEQFSKGAIEFVKHTRHGWLLRADPDDTRLRSLLGATG